MLCKVPSYLLLCHFSEITETEDTRAQTQVHKGGGAGRPELRESRGFREAKLLGRQLENFSKLLLAKA